MFESFRQPEKTSEQKRVESEQKFKESLADLKSTAKNSLGNMLFKAPTDFVKSAAKAGLNPKAEAMLSKGVSSVAKLSWEETKGTAKILGSLGKLAVSYTRKKINE